MKKKPASKSAFFNSRALLSFAFCVIGVFLSLLAFSLYPGGKAFAKQAQSAVPAIAQENSAAVVPAIAQKNTSATELSSVSAADPADSEALPTHELLTAQETAGGAVSRNSFSDPTQATCTLAVLPTDGSTSANARAPSTRFAFSRAHYLITAAELQANGFASGQSPTTLGWRYAVAPGTAGSAPLIIYLENTADTTNNKSATWATAISTMTVVHNNATTALPGVVGPFDITLTGGSPFTYTGGGLYVAYDWGQYTGTLSTTSSIACNTALANGLFGANSAAATVVANSFRPETRLNSSLANDRAVDLVYSYGEVPRGLIPPQAIGAVVTNKGSSAGSNVPATLNVTGADTFTNIQNIATLASCTGLSVVTFAGFTPGAVGTDNIAVSVPADDFAFNNSRSKTMAITPLSYSYKHPGSVANGGVGVNGVTAALVAKFTTLAANSVVDVKLEFNAASATTYKVVIHAESAPGSGTPATAPIYIDAADRTVAAAGPVTITLPAPVAVGPGNFFVGINQTNTTNASLSFDTENPIRAGSFFLAIPTGTAFFDAAPGNNFKLNIGLNLLTGAPSPTPSPSPTVTPTPTVTASPTVTPPATATASATVSPGTPTPSPSTTPCGAAATFTNGGTITIPATGTGATTGAPANPYPSNIAVAGLSGSISKVTVTLTGIAHTFPDDIDVLLVGPGGQTCLLMSDNGGDLDVTGVNLTFDDAAAASLPDGNSLVSGTFKPSNIGGADAFPAPAPAPGANILLSTFNGTAPNGTWALYVVDDAAIDTGSFAGGWSITITTGAGCPSPTPSASVSPGTPPPSPSVSPCGGASVLYNQINNEVTGAGSDVTSQDFEAAFNTNDDFAADDFVVPAGQTWNVNQVVVRGEYNAAQGPAPAFNVFFFSDTATFPGAAVSGGSFLSAPYTATAEVPPARQTFTINLPSNVVLTAGTYWVSVQVRMDFSPAGPGHGQWFWGNRSVASNSAAAWQNPGGAFGVGCTTWGRRTTCLTSSVGPDQLFQIVGTNGAGCATATPSASTTPGTPPPGTPSPSPTCPPALVQGFDDITNLPGAGWVQTNHSTTIGTTGWFQGNDAVFPAHQGTLPNSYIGANFNNTTGTNTISNWLLTPAITLQNGASMTFFTRTTTANPFPDRLQVRMSTNGASTNVGTTATDVGDFTTLLLDINPTYTVGGYPEVYTQFTVNITGVPVATLGRLAFRYFVENGGPTGDNSNYIGIDTFTFGGCGPGGTPTPSPSATAGSPTPTATVCAAGWTAGPTVPPVALVRAPGNFFPGNGRFYSIGGRSADTAGADFVNPFEFNPATSTWATKPSTLPDGLVNNMACGVLTVSGTAQIYCVGGSQSQVVGTTGRVFSYNPATDTFTTLAAGDNWPGSQTNTFLPGGFAVNGNKLYIIGSFNANAVPPVMTAQVWQFDPTAAVGSKWLARADYPQMRGYVPAASIGGFIYTGGGSALDPTGALIDSAESFKYDVAGNAWTPITNIPRATGETRAVVMNGTMWVLGGGRTAPNPSNQVNIYDPVANSWSLGPPFVEARRNFPADSNGTDRIFIAGGYSAALLNTMEIFGGGVCPSPSPTPPGVTPTPSATPGTPTPTATATATVEPSIGPSITPTVSPTPAPIPAAQPVNFSTRMFVQTGDRVGIGGFIITGPVAKDVIIRAIGPSLSRFGITNPMADPTLRLQGTSGLIAQNDNWRDTQEDAIQLTGLAPTNNFESAIVATLAPGAYTAIVAGKNNTTGVALVEVYDLNANNGSKLANISTRAFVGTGEDIVIGGFILGNNTGPDQVIIRGLGPSLSAFGVTNVLANPTLELRDNNGGLIFSNNDWQDNAAQRDIVIAAGLAPSNALEAAIAATLPPNLYTVLLAGLNGGTGNGLVEVYDRGTGVPGPTVSPTPPGTPAPTPPVVSPTPGITPGPTATATATATATVAPSPTPPSGQCEENFDASASLPSGWTATLVLGDPPTWAITNASSDSAPNNAFVNDQDGESDKTLDTRNILVSSGGQVTFRNSYQTEHDLPPAEVFWDGYVMEVSTNGGGTWTDIIDAGGVCVTGCYTGEIDGTANNPLAGRQAWSGDSGGYINSTITLPASFNGLTIKLRFRMGTDEAVAAPGVHVDGLVVTGATCPP